MVDKSRATLSQNVTSSGSKRKRESDSESAEDSKNKAHPHVQEESSDDAKTVHEKTNDTAKKDWEDSDECSGPPARKRSRVIVPIYGCETESEYKIKHGINHRAKNAPVSSGKLQTPPMTPEAISTLKPKIPELKTFSAVVVDSEADFIFHDNHGGGHDDIYVHSSTRKVTLSPEAYLPMTPKSLQKLPQAASRAHLPAASEIAFTIDSPLAGKGKKRQREDDDDDWELVDGHGSVASFHLRRHEMREENNLQHVAAKEGHGEHNMKNIHRNGVPGFWELFRLPREALERGADK